MTQFQVRPTTPDQAIKVQQALSRLGYRWGKIDPMETYTISRGEAIAAHADGRLEIIDTYQADAWLGLFPIAKIHKVIAEGEKAFAASVVESARKKLWRPAAEELVDAIRGSEMRVDESVPEDTLIMERDGKEIGRIAGLGEMAKETGDPATWPFNRFWMVKAVNGEVFNVKHGTRESAANMAKMHANQNPGEGYAVLEVVSVFRARPSEPDAYHFRGE